MKDIIIKKSGIEVKLRPADIVVTTTYDDTFLSKGIREFTDSIYSHCLYYVGEGKIIHNTIGGKQEDSISMFLKDDIGITVLEIKDITEKEREKIVSTAYSRIGRKYSGKSYLGYIITLTLNKILSIFNINIRKSRNKFHEDSRSVCSSAIALIYTIATGKRLDKRIHNNQFTPEDVYACKKLRIKHNPEVL